MKTIQAFALSLVAMTTHSVAQELKPTQVGEMTLDPKTAIPTKRPYSPYAGRKFPTRVYWGESHLHTNQSLDAVGFGVRIGPEEALRFARGEEVTASHGEPAKLSRPLDWLVIADHSEGMGAMTEVLAGKREVTCSTNLASTNS